jgi:FHS family L-fucose permease-like MFS transporter
MAAAPIESVATARPGSSEPYGLALTVLATVFFMWGFVTVLNDILVPHLKAVFALNYGQSLLI